MVLTSEQQELRTYAHLIDGAPVAAPTSIERHDPATGALVARFADGTGEHSDGDTGARSDPTFDVGDRVADHDHVLDR